MDSLKYGRRFVFNIDGRFARKECSVFIKAYCFVVTLNDIVDGERVCLQLKKDVYLLRKLLSQTFKTLLPHTHTHTDIKK